MISVSILLNPFKIEKFPFSYSQFRDEYSLDDIKKSPMVYEPLTKLQCW
jgi:hypothetical protein